MKTKYINANESVSLYFTNSKLSLVEVDGDKIDWDAHRHDIPYYESEIDKKTYMKQYGLTK